MQEKNDLAKSAIDLGRGLYEEPDSVANAGIGLIILGGVLLGFALLAKALKG
jgi:hypothetical protein